ncbi:MAG: acylphosphatase, partial [Anaerolineales bacterium]|nr:acylphosphatase [Anaerolineales bacterium]
MTKQGKRIHINGIVQGVGFRPFVFALAGRYELTGWVRNTSAGVDIAVEGTPAALCDFAAALTAEAPPLAQIDEVTAEDVPANGFVGFEIVKSTAVPNAFQPISPDVSLCDDCLREL